MLKWKIILHYEILIELFLTFVKLIDNMYREDMYWKLCIVFWYYVMGVVLVHIMLDVLLCCARNIIVNVYLNAKMKNNIT
jgi:hypothetical protein